tara:strand:+ start:159 stop:401 length:243 start_codon:yes stop_codon:yes gene_type:complete
MKNLINIVGMLIVYVGTVDRVTGEVVHIELQDTATLQTMNIELPTKAIPCKAQEGLEIEVIQNGAEVVIRCDLPGCPGEE